MRLDEWDLTDSVLCSAGILPAAAKVVAWGRGTGQNSPAWPRYPPDRCALIGQDSAREIEFKPLSETTNYVLYRSIPTPHRTLTPPPKSLSTEPAILKPCLPTHCKESTEHWATGASKRERRPSRSSPASRGRARSGQDAIFQLAQWPYVRFPLLRRPRSQPLARTIPGAPHE